MAIFFFLLLKTMQQIKCTARWGTILTNIYDLFHLPCIQWSICAVHNYSIK